MLYWRSVVCGLHRGQHACARMAYVSCLRGEHDLWKTYILHMVAKRELLQCYIGVVVCDACALHDICNLPKCRTWPVCPTYWACSETAIWINVSRLVKVGPLRDRHNVLHFLFTACCLATCSWKKWLTVALASQVAQSIDSVPATCNTTTLSTKADWASVLRREHSNRLAWSGGSKLG